MATILAHTEDSCRQCGTGKAIDQAKTAANAVALLGDLKKRDVATHMKISPSYLGDLMLNPTPRRPWNADLADKFEAAVKELNK